MRSSGTTSQKNTSALSLKKKKKNTSALSLKKITLARLVAAFISSHLSGVLLKVRCKSSSEVGGLRVAKKVDVSDYQKWAACVLLKKSM